MDSKTCSDCGTTMESGFIPDFGTGIRQMVWHQGTPEARNFLGLNTGTIKVAPEEFVPLTAYRCVNCGSLKLYAQFEEN
ncbi:MAG: hypothetical protein VX438_01665 [Planctomycetota bacterium]|nr:hypothetical protein [Planctomycetota bacterium]